ncbi:MAG: HD domain-containing protein [Candidatus Eremiobacteraeota bacterium]|nr:HD domain-containing protein [Candidatus Eremiobacteraeota bacterium]
MKSNPFGILFSPENLIKNPEGIKELTYENLEKAVMKNNPGLDREYLRKVFDFSKKTHQGQERDEGTPYFAHPFRVAIYLAKRMKVADERIIAAALLHDVLEDSAEVCREDVAGMFGEDVADYVQMMSKRDDVEKEERKRLYRKQIKEAPRIVKMIKLADRIDNISSVHLSPRPDKISRYIKGTTEFYLPLARKNFPEMAEDMERILGKLREDFIV